LSKAPTHTILHFDPLDILVLQVRGEKRWSLQENHDVSNPLTSCAVNGCADPELAGRLAAYVDDVAAVLRCSTRTIKRRVRAARGKLLTHKPGAQP